MFGPSRANVGKSRRNMVGICGWDQSSWGRGPTGLVSNTVFKLRASEHYEGLPARRIEIRPVLEQLRPSPRKPD